MKRAYILVTVVMLSAVLLLSCGETEKIEHAYRIEELPLPSELADAELDECVAADGMIALFAKLDGEGYVLYSPDAESFNCLPLELGLPDDVHFSCGGLAIGSDAIWLTVKANWTDADGNYTSIGRIYCVADGSVKLVCDEINCRGLAASGDKAVTLLGGVLTVISTDGTTEVLEYSETQMIDGMEVPISISDVFGDGKIYLQTNANTQSGETYLVEVDIDSMTFGEPISWEIDNSDASTQDLEVIKISSSEEGIREYKLGERGIVSELVVDYISSDILSGMVKCVATYGDEFVIIYSDDNYHVGILTPIPEEELGDKEIITIAALNPGSIRRDIVEFNRANPELHIKLLDYSNGGTEDGTERMNLSLLSKNKPDILLVSDEVNFEKFARDGLFCDLYELIDADDGLALEEYDGNILSAYEIDGKLYSIVNYVQIEAFGIKQKHYDKLSDTSLDSLYEYARSIGANVFAEEYGQSEFVKAYLEYADVVTEDGIDGEKLQTLLEFAAKMPAEAGGNGFRNDQQYIDDEALLCAVWVSGFNNYDMMCNMSFEEAGTYIGFPGEGYLVTRYPLDGYEFAILSSSKHKDGAWEFVRSYISADALMPVQDEYGNWTNMWSGIPILLDAQEKMYEVALDNGATEASRDAVMALLRSPLKVKRSDDAVYNIVWEEATAYIAGAQSLDSTVDYIENRLSTLLSERE
ncbi:MAG TPA: ABC transporter substrate-binding protein [Firmicutes bacterium]|nr:ABC transporter substrate-binding protein [Bacillota bacterium]